jgi:hypothetical protein
MMPTDIRIEASLLAGARPLAPLLFIPAGVTYCLVYDVTIGEGLIPFGELFRWSLFTLTPWVAGALLFERSVRPGDTRRTLLLRGLVLGLAAYLLSAIATLMIGGGAERAFLTRIPLLATALLLAAQYPLKPLPASSRATGSDEEDLPVLPEQVIYASGAGNYVELHLGDRTAIWRQTMGGAEATLRNAGFVRIHRSYLVARHAIRSVANNRKGPVEVALAGGQCLPVSARYAANLADAARHRA